MRHAIKRVLTVTTLGDRLPEIELLDDRGALWSTSTVTRPTVVILHRHFY